MSESAKEKTANQLLFDDLNQKYSRLVAEAGVLQYNVQEAAANLADKNVKIKNLILELNKAQSAIDKEHAEVRAKAHSDACKEKAKTGDHLRLVSQEELAEGAANVQ